MPPAPEDDAAWKTVMPAADLANGDIAAASFGEARIAVYSVDGEFYATDNICTHEHVELSDGLLEGYVIECPLHNARFDVRTGEVLAAPAELPLKCYPVRVREGLIEVRLEAKGL